MNRSVPRLVTAKIMLKVDTRIYPALSGTAGVCFALSPKRVRSWASFGRRKIENRPIRGLQDGLIP
jgi:hypothetical protein